MSKLYDERPSKLIGIIDTYTAYCFDEACAYISSRIQQDEMPDFYNKNKDEDGKRSYGSASDLYKSMGYEVGSYKKVKE